jgi:hypothetical protein
VSLTKGIDVEEKIIKENDGTDRIMDADFIYTHTHTHAFLNVTDGF